LFVDIDNGVDLVVWINAGDDGAKEHTAGRAMRLVTATVAIRILKRIYFGVILGEEEKNKRCMKVRSLISRSTFKLEYSRAASLTPT
jgi:hypothetical protein